MVLIRYGVEFLLHHLLRLGTAFQEEVTHREIIHLGINEAAIGIVGRADNGFAADVELGVHEHGTSGFFLEPLQDGVKVGVLPGRHRLDPGGVINMGDGRQA